MEFQKEKNTMKASPCVIMFIAIVIFLFFPSLIIAKDLQDKEIDYDTSCHWTNLELYGGEINGIAFDPSDPAKVFASSPNGDGLFISKDGGRKWQALDTRSLDNNNPVIKNNPAYGVRISKHNSNIIWVAHKHSLAMSTNGGDTWREIPGGNMNWIRIKKDLIEEQQTIEQKSALIRLLFRIFSAKNKTPLNKPSNIINRGNNITFSGAISIDPSDHNTVYAGATGTTGGRFSGAIFKTEDGGKTWIKIGYSKFNEFDGKVVDIKNAPNNHNIIWAVTSLKDYGKPGGKVYRSEDGGKNWEIIFKTLDDDRNGGSVTFTSITLHPENPDIAFTGSDKGIIHHYLRDGEWHYRYPVLNGSRFVSALSFFPNKPENIIASWNIPEGRKNYNKISISHDGGDHWKTIASENEFQTFEAHPEEDAILLAGGRYQGIFKSLDSGYTWKSSSYGINAVKVNDLEVTSINDTKHILAATDSGLYEKIAEQEWNRILPYPSYSVKFDSGDNMKWYVGICGRLVRQTKTQNEYLESYSNYLNNDQADACVVDIKIDHRVPKTIFIASGNTIYKSEDGGDQFQKILKSNEKNNKNHSFNVIAIDPGNSDHIFAGMGNFYSPGHSAGLLWESTDGGHRWFFNSLSERQVIINDLFFIPDNPEIIYAGCGSYKGTDIPLYKSLNGGKSWKPCIKGIPAIKNPLTNRSRTKFQPLLNAVTDLEPHHKNPDLIYASTYGTGIFITHHLIDYWNQIGSPGYPVNAIASGSAYSGTDGGSHQLTGIGLLLGKITFGDPPNHVNAGVSCEWQHGASPITTMSHSDNGIYFMPVPASLNDIVTAKYYNMDILKLCEKIETTNIYGGEINILNITIECD